MVRSMEIVKVLKRNSNNKTNKWDGRRKAREEVRFPSSLPFITGSQFFRKLKEQNKEKIEYDISIFT